MVNIQQKKGYFFDLDGTLIDSSSHHTIAFQKVLTRHRPDIVKTFQYEPFKGKSTSSVFKELGIEDQREIDFLSQGKKRIYLEDLYQNRVALFPRAKELLQFLSSQGKEIFIVTSASPESANAVVEINQLSRWIHGVVTSQEVKNNKPHPDIFLLALKKSRLSAPEVIVIEDSLSGKTAAQKAGLDFLLVNQPVVNNSQEQFKTLQELHAFIQKQLQKT